MSVKAVQTSLIQIHYGVYGVYAINLYICKTAINNLAEHFLRLYSTMHVINGTLQLKVIRTYDSGSHKELLKFHTWNKNNNSIFNR